MVSYYDWLLGAIAAAMIVGAAAGVHPAVALHQGLASGSLVSTLILYEVLFRNPPTEPTGSPTVASAVVGVGWLLTVVLTY
ncbi:hypothetical protein [Halorubrum sp. Boch-26]|uniref:hypothetical protein n=1 Tax=Halorubrum sp. Boch-26 TaxID=2994426 RepID=UPI002469340E|nr:hypothetical protein [Halorubrum sp. Boch-26]